MPRAIKTSPTPKTADQTSSFSPPPTEPKQGSGNAKWLLIAVGVAALVFIISAGAYLFTANENKSNSTTAAPVKTTNKNTQASQSAQPQSTDKVDQALDAVDTKFKTLDEELNGIDEGLNDKSLDLTQ